jgi:hypothetical protein
MRPSTLERAFELAESGRFVSVTEIRNRLSAEGFFTAELCGPLLCKQLLTIMVKARLTYVEEGYRRAACAHGRQA